MFYGFAFDSLTEQPINSTKVYKAQVLLNFLVTNKVLLVEHINKELGNSVDLIKFHFKQKHEC